MDLVSRINNLYTEIEKKNMKFWIFAARFLPVKLRQPKYVNISFIIKLANNVISIKTYIYACIHNHHENVGVNHID